MNPTVKKKSSRRWIIWIGLPSLAALVIVAVGMGRRKENTFFTARVEKGDVISVVQATGTINAVTSVLVGSQVSGTIEKLYADFNSKVTKGQKIAQLETSLFKARYDQAVADWDNAKANQQSIEVQVDVQKADVAAAKANTDKARAALTQAQLDEKRALDLFQQGIVSAAQRDAAQATFDSAKASVAAADAQYLQSQAKLKSQMSQVDQARAQVAQRKAASQASKVDLDHATIYAPIDGTVVARNVDVGQTVAASLQAPTIFTIAEDLSKMLVYVKTDESDVGNVRVGGRATFKVDAFPRDTFFGRVKQIRINPTTVQNVVTYDTVIEFENREEKLLPGMTAYVTIPVGEIHDTLKVPNGAIRFRPEISDEERKALLAKAGIESGDRKGRGMAAGSSDKPGRGEAGREGMGGGGGRSGGKGGGGKGGGRRGGGEGAPSDIPQPAVRRPTADVAVIWKLTPDKQLLPLQVKTGITDYTFTAVTEVLKGQLNEGDLVVTGMAIPNRASTGQANPFGGPGGRPGGGPGGPGGRGPGR